MRHGRCRAAAALAATLATRGAADPRLFADLSSEDLVPRAADFCQLLPVSKCLNEFQTGRFDGSQMHRSIELENETRLLLHPPHARLLLLITTVWRNFQRRRLQRAALSWCRQMLDRTVVWRFLMGDSPSWLLRRAVAEAAAHDDMMLLGGPDELEYSHIGDAYELKEANPELTKIVRALRHFVRVLRFDYVLVADDDSFVSLPSALELLDMLPPERVYMGNMIDSVPQRWDEKRQKLRAEYTVSIYLSAPSKVPVFTHGMGFVLSQDVAHHLAEAGLLLKSRGNDDLLMGVWLRSIEHLYYLHYWPLFMDHEEFGGAFARPCEPAAVVVHRMTPERWQNFSRTECHLCGPAAMPLDSEPDPPPRRASGRREAPVQSPCLPPERLACAWRQQGPNCLQGCSRTNFSCTPALCHAICQPPGQQSTLCAQRSRPRLAICIFGSSWQNSRVALRASLRGCVAERLGTQRVAHVFMMGPLPREPLRRTAVQELLLHRDMVVLRGAYAYAEAWPVLEERVGGADFVLLLDHRSFVNVPYVLHVLLPKLPTERTYAGCLLDETLFDQCAGRNNTRCDYLRRRRAPLFAHGMGVLVSADVAQFVASTARRLQLREHDVPIDLAFGMWVQPLEDLHYESVHEVMHEWPGAGLGFSLEPSSSSAVVFPMTRERWRWFEPHTCSLRPPHTVQWEPTENQIQELAVEGQTQHPEGIAPAAPVQQLDCWRGMGGRPEAWYLVCCELRWERCWGGTFTEASCCSQVPSAGRTPGLNSAGEVLRKFLGFSHRELRALLAELDNSSSVETGNGSAALGLPGRFPCLAPRDCAREAFARFYQSAWGRGLLPLRHPWITDMHDQLFGLAMRQREDNDGWAPRGHESTFERVQLAHWLEMAAEQIQPAELPGERRCLEWDSGGYSRRYFSRHCAFNDVLTYEDEAPRIVEGDGGKRMYFADVHEADLVVPANSTAIVICCQVFEHLRRPHIAMAQLFKLVGPGGFVVWSAPMFSELHGSPDDYFRYTPPGAVALAEDAGFAVVGLYNPGGLRELVGYFLGLTAPYWRKEDLLEDSSSSWPLQVYMLLQKPW